MPRIYSPSAEVVIGPVVIFDSFPSEPPVWFHTVAPVLHDSSQAEHDGAYHRESGELHSQGTPVYRDTFLHGNGNLSGYPFSVNLGGSSWTDNWVSPKTGKHGIVFQNAADGGQFDIVQDDQMAMQDRCVTIHRGISDLNTSKIPGNYNCYLELVYGNEGKSGGAYRLCFEAAAPVRLEYWGLTDDAWKRFSNSSLEFNAANLFYDLGGEVRLKLHPNPDRGEVVIEFPRGYVLRHTPERDAQATTLAGPNAPAALPPYWQLHFYGKNGFAGLEVGTYGHAPLNITTPKRNYGQMLPGVGTATIVPNVLGNQDGSTTWTGGAVQFPDGSIQASLSGTRPDDGDGNGSPDPVTCSDVLVYRPAKFSNDPGTPFVSIDLLRSCTITERAVWDDILRISHTSGEIIFQNDDLRYSGAVGNMAINIFGSNGYEAANRCRGIAGHNDPGIEFLRHDPVRIGTLPYADFMAKLNVAIGEEVILDGFSAHTAVWLLLNFAIDEKYLQFIPNDGFPPYANTSTYIPILPKGTGDNPKYRFTPDQTLFSAILQIVQDTGRVSRQWNGRVVSTPYYFWFDPFGFAHFQPYDAAFGLPVMWFSSRDQSGVGLIEGPLRVSNSVTNIRTDVTVQGQDEFDHSLINVHRPLTWNRNLKGYRDILIERDERFSSNAYAEQHADMLAIQASLPTQLVEFTTAFRPNVFPGNIVGLDDEAILGSGLYGSGLYVVLEMNSTWGFDAFGSGVPICTTRFKCRSAERSVVF